MGLFKRVPAGDDADGETSWLEPLSYRKNAVMSKRWGPRSFLDPHLCHAVTALDRVHHVHPLGDLTEDGVLLVQVGLARMADEELRPARVLAGVSHRERARVVNLLLARGLTLDLKARTAGAGAHRATALNHEVGDHPV